MVSLTFFGVFALVRQNEFLYQIPCLGDGLVVEAIVGDDRVHLVEPGEQR